MISIKMSLPCKKFKFSDSAQRTAASSSRLASFLKTEEKSEELAQSLKIKPHIIWKSLHKAS